MNKTAEQKANDWQNRLNWDVNGLIPAIVQDKTTHRVLMFAWMNKESFLETVLGGHAVYWSRSRQKLWRKGEESGHYQKVHAIRTDCDQDTLLLIVAQTGGIACHTGRESCFFYELNEDGWVATDPIVKDPREIYST